MLDTSQFHIKNFDIFVEVKDQIAKDTRKHGANQYENQLTDEMRNKAKELSENGWSYSKIGEKLGISKGAVSGIIYRDRHTRKYKGKYG